MRLIFSLFLLLFLASTAAAQVTASARVDSAELLLGDQVKLHVEVRHPKGVVVSPPNLEDIKMDTVIEFLEQGNWDTTNAGSAILLRRQLTFIVWDTGRMKVPSIPFAVFQGKESDSVFTPAIQIRVDLPPVDSTLNDIKPIIEEPTVWQDYLPYMGALLAVLIVLWLVYIARKKKKEQALAPLPPVILQPHEIALQKLEALKNKQLWQAGQVKLYHSELTHILRQYLEARYGIHALEQTTDEILVQMQKLNLPSVHLEKLASLLQTVDLVKFAKAQPPVNFHEEALALVQQFILATKPVAALETAAAS